MRWEAWDVKAFTTGGPRLGVDAPSSVAGWTAAGPACPEHAFACRGLTRIVS